MKSLILKGAALFFLVAATALGGSATVSADAPSTTTGATTTSSSTSANCVDGKVRSNLSVTWNSTSSVSVKTVGEKPLCADTTLYFSSYVMPDNYDGSGFGGPTSYPQTLFKTVTAVLKAGTDGKTTLNVPIPQDCKNMQIDLYYGPEITTVTAAGHGVQYISGKVLSKTTETCEPVNPPTPPEVPKEEAQTPSTPAPQVTVAAPAQALPSTGLNFGAVMALTGATVVAGTATAEVVRIRARR